MFPLAALVTGAEKKVLVGRGEMEVEGSKVEVGGFVGIGNELEQLSTIFTVVESPIKRY